MSLRHVLREERARRLHPAFDVVVLRLLDDRAVLLEHALAGTVGRRRCRRRMRPRRAAPCLGREVVAPGGAGAASAGFAPRPSGAWLRRRSGRPRRPAPGRRGIGRCRSLATGVVSRRRQCFIARWLVVAARRRRAGRQIEGNAWARTMQRNEPESIVFLRLDPVPANCTERSFVPRSRFASSAAASAVFDAPIVDPRITSPSTERVPRVGLRAADRSTSPSSTTGSSGADDSSSQRRGS